MRGSTLNFQRVHRNQKPCLLSYFLNREVVVNCQDYKVKGKLVHFQPCSNNPRDHRPEILIVKRSEGLTIIRGSWFSIGV